MVLFPCFRPEEYLNILQYRLDNLRGKDDSLRSSDMPPAGAALACSAAFRLVDARDA
jgi:hypothetical protein